MKHRKKSAILKSKQRTNELWENIKLPITCNWNHQRKQGHWKNIKEIMT